MRQGVLPVLASMVLLSACVESQEEPLAPARPLTEEPTGTRQERLVSFPTPVAYWKLDEDCATTTSVTDSSPNAFHGTRYGGVGCAEAQIDRGASFDGVDDRIEVADRPAFHFTSAMTVTAWVKPSRTTGMQTLLAKWYVPDSYLLLIEAGYYRFSVLAANGQRYSVSAPATVNQWAHVSATFSGTAISIRVNGGPTYTTAFAATTLADSARPVTLGYHPSWNAFQGQLDEVRLYNTVLTDQQRGVLAAEVWPNAQSKANSDPWLAQNHANLRVLRPGVLALNFVNAKTNAQMLSHMNQFITAMKESSRDHGYQDASAVSMLQYSIYKAVDLRDATVPVGYPYRNSSKYPRESPVQGYWGFDYARLFSREFADYYGVYNGSGRTLDLCELVNAGLVHEVWVYGDADVPDVSAAEVLELKPAYDSNRVRIAGQAMNPCAGNGCFDSEDVAVLPAHCTRSVRIAWLNNTRGIGCFMEGHAHGIESTGNSNLIPYFSTYFKEFADFNLDTRYGRPFRDWYACPYGVDCLNHASACAHQELVTGAALPASCSSCATTVCASDPFCCNSSWDATCVSEAVEWCGGRVAYNTSSSSGTIYPYVPACQNAHFPPNGRRHYDRTSAQAQVSTCENFRQRNGSNGQDKRTVFTTSRFSGYASLAPDCMGDWLVYWYQNMPGYQNKAKDNAGAEMLPWWPFRFY